MTEDVQRPATQAGASTPLATRVGFELRGTPVAPGVVLGRVHRKDYDLTSGRAQRVPLDAIDRELNRFRRALEASGTQLRDLKRRLVGQVEQNDARILDTHLAYLKDSAFIHDVENLVLNEQMTLEAAIGKVISDFDRIFRLVENENLRQSAVDLRDVGIRVLRNLERHVDAPEAKPAPRGYVLVARELSIVDMFDLANEHVQGIATEEGGLIGHAAIFARSMRIPTITGVVRLLDEVFEGDYVIVDAAEGVLRVNPTEAVLEQYRELGRREVVEERSRSVPEWATEPARTHDGSEVRVAPICANPTEVEQAGRLGMQGVGLYRTELVYLLERLPPSRETLVRHYAGVVAAARGGPVTFRLLHVDSGLDIPYLHHEREQNPKLGHAGVRLLLAHEDVLRRQLQGILMAAVDCELRIAIPLVTDCGELRRVKEILFEERLALRAEGVPFQEELQLGCVLETPACLLGLRDLARESDFFTIGLDSLTQYVLAADRDNGELAPYFESIHPYVVRVLQHTIETCGGVERELEIFGVTALDPHNLSLLLGLGLRSFCVPPAGLQAFLATVHGTDVEAAAQAAREVGRSTCVAEAQSQVGAFRHGYARP